MFVTVGDYHISIDMFKQRAACLGLDPNQLIESRRCSTLLQAEARARFARREGDFLQAHFGE